MGTPFFLTKHPIVSNISPNCIVNWKTLYLFDNVNYNTKIKTFKNNVTKLNCYVNVSTFECFDRYRMTYRPRSNIRHQNREIKFSTIETKAIDLFEFFEMIHHLRIFPKFYWKEKEKTYVFWWPVCILTLSESFSCWYQ